MGTRDRRPPGLNEDAIAEATGLSPAFVLELLETDCERGMVVRTSEGRFRLSDRAERVFGQALRDLPEGPSLVGRRRLGRVA